MPPKKVQCHQDQKDPAARRAAASNSLADDPTRLAPKRLPSPSLASATSWSFHIDFYNRQDHYLGRIVLLGTDRKQSFQGVDIAAIAKFILQNLPRLAHLNSTASFFGEIRLFQLGRFVVKGESLKALRPFQIQIRCDLLDALFSDSMAYTNDTYAVEASILDADETAVVDHNAEGGSLEPDAAALSTSIEMGGLRPASYVLRIDVILPARRLVESTRLVLCVAA